MSPAPDALWAALPVPAFVIDAADRIVALNPAAEQFLNTSARLVRGARLLDRLATEPPIGDALARVRADGSDIHINGIEVGTGPRPPVACNLRLAPLAGAGELLLLIEPRQIADRLGRARAAKSGAKSAIGMAEMLAHEIKNPLAGIAGAAQLLAMNLRGEDHALTDLIVAETRRIVKLLAQVEQFGNLLPPERRAVNLHDLLDRARRSAAVGFARHMRFVEAYDPSLPPTWADGDQMLQVFLNLIRNAAEAAGAVRGTGTDTSGGTIRLRTFYAPSLRLRREDGSGRALPLQVEIEDDGPGLPPEIAAEIFEPFISGRENGTGLGLALVSRIVSDHDGWIDVDSVPGRTVFRISLPVAPRVDGEES